VERGSGIVLANFGRGVLVQHEAGLLHCVPKGRRQRIVCGDRIEWWRARPGDLPSIEALLPRRNLLERIDARGRAEPVAANLDRIGILAAPQPQPDWFLLDRYWAAARLLGLPALLILNKADLGLDSLAHELDTYRALGLECHEVSACTQAGVASLLERLAQGVSLLVGQSGVGKSSLVNALVPGAATQTAALTREAEGRHTTTTARRYALPYAGAALVDAPGVRDFAPPIASGRAVQQGFVEIESLATGCRFADCRHFEEPDCAVRSAVTAEQVSKRRYESYRRLQRLYEKLMVPGR